MISEFPLFVFTTFAGIAAGSYAVSLFFPVRRDGAGKPWAFPLLMLALLAIGLIGCLLHLQHPERFLNALFNPAAGITLEAYFSIALGVVLVADVLCCVLRGSCPKWLRAVGAAAALLLAFVMGYAYSISFGVTAWASPISVLLFLVGDVAMGAGLCAALSYGDGPSRALSLTVAVASAAFAVSSACEGVLFAGLGIGAAPQVVACALSLFAAVLGFAAKKAKPHTVAACQCASIVIAVCVARYAFYAACTF